MDRYATYALDALPDAYAGRLLNSADLEVTRELADPLWNATPEQTVTLELDNQDGALTTGFLAGLRGHAMAVKRYDLASGFLATKFTGLVHWPRLTDQKVSLECGVLDRSLLTEPVPAPVVTTAIFPNAVDVGATIPAGFGQVVTSPCPNVSDDKVNSVFDYLIGHGTWTVSALARNGPSEGALYSIQFFECVRAAGGPATSWAEVPRTDLYPGYTVVRFILRQSDFNNGLHKIYFTGAAGNRNFANAVSTLLTDPTWGLRQPVNAASITAAAALLDALPVPLYCDGMMLEARPAQEWLADLLMVRGMWLERNAAGELLLQVDTLRTTVAMAIGNDPGDGPRNLVSASERSGPAPEEYIRKVVLKYRRDYVRNEYIGHAERAVNAEGKARKIPHAFLRNATSADCVVDYLGKRIALEQEPVEVTVTQEGRALVLGDLVYLTRARMGYAGALLRVWKITERLTTLTLALRPWAPTTYTYTPAVLATDPIAGTEADFSHTAPSAATGLVLSSTGTTLDGQGKVSAWVILGFTNPASNFARADVLYRLTGATEYSVGATNVTPGATTARLEGLAPAVSYDYAVLVTNAYALTSGLATLAAQIAPTDASIPAAPTAIAMRQSGAKVVEIIVTATPPADWGTTRLYRNTTSAFGGAVEIQSGKKLVFHDQDIVYGTTYWYWAKIEDTSGNLGGRTVTGPNLTVVTIDTPDITPTAVTDVSYQVLTSVSQTRNATQAQVAVSGLSVSRSVLGTNGVLISFAGVWGATNGSAGTQSVGVNIVVRRDGATDLVGLNNSWPLAPTPGPGNASQVSPAVTLVDFPGAGTHTYTVLWIVASSSAVATITATCYSALLECVELKR